MVARGSLVTVVIGGSDYIVAWDDRGLDVRVAAVLASVLPVRTLTIQTPTWLSTAALGGLLTDQYDYTATVVVQPTTDYADVQDIVSIVQNAFYQASDIWPTSASATQINNVSTGQPGQGPPGTTIDLGRGLGNLTDFLNTLTGNLGTIGIVLVVLVLAIGAVLVFGPKSNLRGLLG